MRFKTHNGYVLCKKIQNEKVQIDVNGLVLEKEQLPIYQIIDLGDILDDSRVNVGDKIITNSIPAYGVLDGIKYYLINLEHIVGTIKE